MKRWLVALSSVAVVLCLCASSSVAHPPLGVGVVPGGVTVAYKGPRVRPYGFGYYTPGYSYSPYGYGGVYVPGFNGYGYYAYPYQPYVYVPNTYIYGGGPYIYRYTPRPYIYYY